MFKFICTHSRYFIASLAFLIYLVIINRASYLSIYVDLILITTFWVLYRPLSHTLGGRMSVFLYIFVIMFANGLLHGNRFDFMLMDLVYLMPILPMILRSPKFREDFIGNQLEGYKRLLPFLLLLYFLVFSYMGYSWTGSIDARFAYNRDSKLLLFAPLTSLAFIPVLLSFSDLKGGFYTRMYVILGFLAFFHMGFCTQTKSVFLGPVLVLILKFLFSANLSNKMKYIIVGGLVAIISFNIMSVYMPEMMEAFLAKFDTDDASNTERLDETFEFLGKCNIFEIIFGKGFGGIKTFHGEEYIGGLNMLHMGWGFLMMKGGLVLLSFIYFPLFYIIIKDFLTKKYVFVIIAIFFLFKDQSHTHFTTLNGALLYWFLVYIRFYYRKSFDRYVASWK